MTRNILLLYYILWLCTWIHFERTPRSSRLQCRTRRRHRRRYRDRDRRRLRQRHHCPRRRFRCHNRGHRTTSARRPFSSSTLSEIWTTFAWRCCSSCPSRARSAAWRWLCPTRTTSTWAHRASAGRARNARRRPSHTWQSSSPLRLLRE